MSENLTWIALSPKNEKDELLQAAVQIASDSKCSICGHCSARR